MNQHHTFFTQLNEQYTLLQEERALLKEQREKLAESKEAFEREAHKKWGRAIDDSRRVKLNVGGQLFETSPSTLARDRFSLLAAIVTQPPESSSRSSSSAAEQAGAPESKTAEASAVHEGSDAAPAASSNASQSGTPRAPPPNALTGGGGSHFAVDRQGVVFIDRDWWLFRHILAFLRHGALPSNLALLRQLYIESAYYRLHSLRTAIERKLAADDVPGEVLDDDTQGLLPENSAHGAALPGPHASYLAGPHSANAPLDTTDASVRQGIAARAAEALSWATAGHGLSRALGASLGGGGGLASTSAVAARAAPAPHSLAGSLGGVRNMAALLASDELDGGWGVAGGVGTPARGAWGDMPQGEVDRLAAELKADEEARHGRRRHGHGHRRRDSRGGSARSEGGYSSLSDASSGGHYSHRSHGSEPGRFGLAAAAPRRSHGARDGMTLDERASATRLPDRLGLWGGR